MTITTLLHYARSFP